MARVQVWHTIPDSYELACDDVRCPKAGECYVNLSDVVCLATVDHDTPRVIVRKGWEWPPWLLCDWVARNADGKLTLGVGAYVIGTHAFYAPPPGSAVIASESLLAINLPPASDWPQSLRINPQRKVVAK